MDDGKEVGRWMGQFLCGRCDWMDEGIERDARSEAGSGRDVAEQRVAVDGPVLARSVRCARTRASPRPATERGRSTTFRTRAAVAARAIRASGGMGKGNRIEISVKADERALDFRESIASDFSLI